MLLAGRNQSLSDQFSIDEIFCLFKDAGYDALEYCLTDKAFYLKPDTMEDFFIDHVNRLCKKYDMSISAVCNHRDFTYDDRMFAFMKSAIPKIKRLGTDVLITGSSHPGASMPPFKFQKPNYWEDYRVRLNELLDFAKPYGVRIAVEPEPNNFLVSTADYFRMCEEMGRDDLYVNMDICHAYLTDNDMFESIRSLKGRIAHVHLENIHKGEHLHRLPSDGDMDLRKVFEVFREIGYTGAGALDFYGEIYRYEEVSPECVRYLRSVMGEADTGRKDS